jgi:hypothetical protein
MKDKRNGPAGLYRLFALVPSVGDLFVRRGTMNNQIHGLISISLVLIAVAFGATAMFLSAPLLGLAYLVTVALALGVVLYAYCAKCADRARCGHVLPGKIVTAFTNRQTEPYTSFELILVGVALLLLLGLPQPWLWRFPGLLAAFWVLTAIALLQIRAVVCRACNNKNCPAYPHGKA